MVDKGQSRSVERLDEIASIVAKLRPGDFGPHGGWRHSMARAGLHRLRYAIRALRAAATMGGPME